MSAAPPLFGRPAAAGDNLLLLRLRWLLLLWIGALVGVEQSAEPWRFWGGVALVVAFVLSQVALWRLPARWMRGLPLYTTVFLLDLGFVVGALLLTGHADPRLLLVMFLTLFITALVQKISLSLVVSGVVMAVYAHLRLQGSDAFGWEDARQLMDLPFLLITSLHASVILSEAGFHQEIMESLEADNASLSQKLGLTARELKDRVRFIVGAFDAVPAAVLVLDANGQIRVFNRHAEALFACSRHAVLDRPLHAVPFLALLRQELLRRGGEELHGGVWLQRARGGPFYALMRNSFARDAEGALLNFAVFLSPTDPPADAPTYEAWQAQRTGKVELLQDGTLQPAPAPAPLAADADPPSSKDGKPSPSAAPQRETPATDEAPSAPPSSKEGTGTQGSLKDRARTDSGLVQRILAVDVNTQGPGAGA